MTKFAQECMTKFAQECILSQNDKICSKWTLFPNIVEFIGIHLSTQTRLPMHRRLRVGTKGADAPPTCQGVWNEERRKYFGVFLILILKCILLNVKLCTNMFRIENQQVYLTIMPPETLKSQNYDFKVDGFYIFTH